MLLPALILLRGLPGSGKSSIAEVLSESKWPVISVDDYFTGDDGSYEFRYKENHLAYKQCVLRTEQYMMAGMEKIIIDNTLTLPWEAEPYFELAKKFNYYLFVLTVEKHHNSSNIHRITEEQIRKMAAGYTVKLY